MLAVALINDPSNDPAGQHQPANGPGRKRRPIITSRTVRCRMGVAVWSAEMYTGKICYSKERSRFLYVCLRGRTFPHIYSGVVVVHSLIIRKENIFFLTLRRIISKRKSLEEKYLMIK